MAITRAEVLHVARLSRLELSEQEADAMAGELARVLDYVKQLDAVNTDGVEPTLSVSASRAPFREDAVVPSLDKTRVLAEAPRASDTGFLVPGFVDES
jgi:aspartyl-tRNA(Asn)/glutamyl-tRNA(Gln) amidotransferase subunit C